MNHEGECTLGKMSQATIRKHPKKTCAKSRKAKGIIFLVMSVALAAYALPCFAASVWDEGLSSQGGGTLFASPINDSAYEQAAEEVAASEEAAASVRAASKVNASVTETTGPGIAADDGAVTAAKKRVQAVNAASTERSNVIQSMASAPVKAQDRTLELMSGAFSLMLALLLGILGTRFIVGARRQRAQELSRAYNHALKA